MRAVDSRKLIGQAQGILMERYDLDQDRAFEVLRRYSRDSNVKLREVAQLVVDTRQLPDTPS
jgi:AmiR/NasT family two-component response regulator